MSDETRCPRCNAVNPSGTAFCKECGASLDEVADAADQADPLEMVPGNGARP